MVNIMVTKIPTLSGLNMYTHTHTHTSHMVIFIPLVGTTETTSVETEATL